MKRSTCSIWQGNSAASKTSSHTSSSAGASPRRDERISVLLAPLEWSRPHCAGRRRRGCPDRRGRHDLSVPGSNGLPPTDRPLHQPPSWRGIRHSVFLRHAQRGPMHVWDSRALRAPRRLPARLPWSPERRTFRGTLSFAFRGPRAIMGGTRWYAIALASGLFGSRIMPNEPEAHSEAQPDTQRAFAVWIVRRLREAGFEAYFAGGCVRDELLGRQPADYDVATSAPPERVRAVFGQRRTREVGSAFGVVLVRPPRGSDLKPVEVVTFREDFDYSDGRHPDRIRFSSAERDAQRRDFTINGLFYDPIEGRVIDFVGGREDLRRRVIRAIGNPDRRFAEDKLRMIRAVRFAAVLGFRIASDTLQAIRRHAHELLQVSAERITDELRRMLTHPTRARAVALCHECGLLERIFPELSAIVPPPSPDSDAAGQPPATPAPPHGSVRSAAGHRMDAWTRTLCVLENLGNDPRSLERARETQSDGPSVTFGTAMAALLLEVRRDCDVTALGRRLRFSNAEIREIRWLLDSLPVALAATSVQLPPLTGPSPEAPETSSEPSMGVSPAQNVELADLRIVLADEKSEQLLQLLWAVEKSSGPRTPAWDACLELLRRYAERPLLPPPLITGDDLRSLGHRPGPAFARALQAVRRAQLNERIDDRAAALEIARSVLETQAADTADRGSPRSQN
ncbi:MAG: CCA tRNA nucleotidyltransferase [Planctomycetota bacterium]|nr:MAG: CCA tRNA nucleotidyltransferase [Planctomycetota bacterium]